MSLVTSAGAETRAAVGVRVWTDQQHSVTVQGQTQLVGGCNDQRTLGCCLEVKKYGLVMEVVGITCSHWSIGMRCFIRHQERDIDIGVVTGRSAEWTVISLTDFFLDILDTELWFGNVTEALAGGWGGVRRKLPVGSLVNVMKQEEVVTAKVTQHHERFFNVSCASTAHFTEHDCGSIVAVNSVLCGVVVHAPSEQEAEVAHFNAVLSKIKSDLWSHSDFNVELATRATRLKAEIKPVLEVDLVAELVNQADCCQESDQLPADSTSYQPPPVTPFDETAEKCFKQLLLKGTTREKQTRLVVVGPPKAGKTHFIRQLLGQQYDPEGDKNTNGVVINFGACVSNKESTVTWKARSEKEHTVTQAKLVAEKMISVEAKEKVETEWEEILICPKCPTVVEPGLKMCENCSTPIARKSVPEVADESRIQIDREDCNKLEDGMADDNVYAMVYEQYKSKIYPSTYFNWMPSNWFSLREGGSSQDSDTGKDTIRLSVWDLDGQHVNCSINQIFLTGMAIYLLVIDLTKGLDQPINIEKTDMGGKDRAVVGVPQTLGGFLEICMRSIHQNSVGKGNLPEDAKDNDRLCPSVIIVGTHKDKVTQSTKDERLNEIRKFLETKPHYDQIHSVFFAVDNTDMEDPALQEIRQAIEKIAQQQTYWGKKRPVRWVLLEEKLRTISKERPYVHFSEAESHAKKYNISKDELYICLSYFHEMGMFPFYDHEKLGDIVILDPQWLFNAIKTVLTLPHCKHIEHHSQTIKSYLKSLAEKAILREKLVNIAWKYDDRLLENKNLLLELMQRYDLAYLYTPINLSIAPPCASGERLFLIPSFLQVAKPMEFILADNAVIKPIYIQSKYDFIPQGLFLRLLASMHKEMFLHSRLLFGDYACFRIQAPNSTSATGSASTHVLEMKYDECRIKLKVGTLLPGDKFHTPCKSVLYAREIVEQKLEGLRRELYPYLEWDFAIQLNSSGESVFVPINEDNVLQQGYLIYQGHGQTVDTSLYSIWFQREDAKCPVFTEKEEKEQESKNQATLKGAPLKVSSTPYTCIGLEECEEVEVPPCKEDILTFDSKTVYDCLTEKRGRAVIINNVNFYSDNPKYEDRYGTEKDVQRLTKLFKKLHYIVITHTNLSAGAINDIALDEGKLNHDHYSSFIMVVLSHGSKNTVIGSDGFHIEYDQIRQPFTTTNCPSLKGKPKMFFISACQGDQSASGSPEDEAQGSLQSTRMNASPNPGASGDPPEDADMILATATTPGKVSWRSTETGTRFIKSLVTVFSAKACKDDLASMLTQVNNEVASMTSGGRSQVSNIQLNTLRKKLYFCPGYYMQGRELKQYSPLQKEK